MPRACSMSTPALLELQRAFAAALLSEADAALCAQIIGDGIPAPERLRIHRNTCRSTRAGTLAMTYPAVERLVGREFFTLASERYAIEHPARSGYLNEYGGELAAFLAAFEPARSLPYLPDVARFEWALGVAANAADAARLEADALAGIGADVRFEPHPSVSLLELRYPADEIADAVLAGDEAAMREVDLHSGAVRLVVHRGTQGLATERVGARAHAFLTSLFAGEPLGRAAAAAPREAPGLLAQQLVKGRLSAYRALP